ncbi:MAG: asparagine synthase (glutamine-hydrolyzing) [Terrimicrobiaceae bacterium]|nr:asparagine synthase (glutamine-hydrolyzing) [Terrimicrobiaceae bacterium]
MCGIAGFLGAGGRGDIERMTRRLAHRGPDAEGFFSEPAAGLHLGHRRLSVLDIAGGAQPMTSPCGRFTIVFNGEIYNHGELRRSLEARGADFRTDHSDTEVLLQGFRLEGAEFVRRLNGMWAFAVWDSARRSLFLSRDRFGKKPLYWFFENGVFAFASELKALLEHPAAPRAISAIARAKFLAHAFIPSPHSMVERVWKLPGGCNMTVEPGAPPRINTYWTFRIEPEEPHETEEELAERLRGLLDAAVRRRMVADVPVGVFLSGGIDSSVVARLASRAVGSSRLRTFAVGFREPSFDESEQARRTADWLGTEHTTEVLDLDRARQLLPGLLASVDEPQGDNSLLPTWLLCGFTRRHVTVAVSGDGGDELFCGYDTFRGLRAAEMFHRMVPRAVHPALRALAARMPVSHSNLSLDFKIKRGLRGASYPPALWNPVWLSALEPHEIEEFTGWRGSVEELYSETIGIWDSARSPSLVDRTLEFYTRLYLHDGILPKVDRASMLHGLEVRCPFLDIEVADFARRLPSRLKLSGGTTKRILKRAFHGLLPGEILLRKKKGFGSPVGAWFRQGMIAPRDKADFVRRRVQAHQSGRSDERLFLWCQLAFECWRDSL